MELEPKRKLSLNKRTVATISLFQSLRTLPIQIKRVEDALKEGAYLSLKELAKQKNKEEWKIIQNCNLITDFNKSTFIPIDIILRKENIKVLQTILHYHNDNDLFKQKLLTSILSNKQQIDDQVKHLILSSLDERDFENLQNSLRFLSITLGNSLHIASYQIEKVEKEKITRDINQSKLIAKKIKDSTNSIKFPTDVIDYVLMPFLFEQKILKQNTKNKPKPKYKKNGPERTN